MCLAQSKEHLFSGRERFPQGLHKALAWLMEGTGKDRRSVGQGLITGKPPGLVLGSFEHLEGVLNT